MRPTSAQIDLSAIAHNVSLLTELAGEAQLCVVVKADGYGHGAVPVARTAVAAGASWLAVALVEEGAELRENGIETPILLLSEPRPNEMIEVATHRLRPTVYSAEGIAALTAVQSTAEEPLGVHLKIDTGMHRVGVPPSEAQHIVKALKDKPGIALEGIWTHCATADNLISNFADIQLDRFEQVLAELDEDSSCPPMRHAANSSALLTRSRSAYDLVRVGITAYGISPLAEDDPLVHPSLQKPSQEQGAANAPASLSEMAKFVISQLRPSMRLRSEVSFVKQVAAGERISYGQLHKFEHSTTVATVPIGYADGVRRDFGLRGGEVLIGGKRCPVVGAVTMDQLMADVGPSSQAQAGDEVVLIGRQDEETITASEIAKSADTIPYEVVCDVGKRVRREYV